MALTNAQRQKRYRDKKKRLEKPVNKEKLILAIIKCVLQFK